MAELDSIDYLFVAPSSSVHRIQEAQTTIYHALWELMPLAAGSATVPADAGCRAARWSPGSATSSWATTGSAWRSPAGWPASELPDEVTRVDRLRHQRHAPGL